MSRPHIITIVNQKGGTGKSTTAHILGTILARQDKKVLVIDLDSRGNLTMCLGFNQPDDLPCTIAHLFKGLIDDTFSFQKENYILHSEGCDLIPSSIQLSGIEPSLANAMSRESLLKRLLSLIQDEYQYILIDCPPSLGLLTNNALAAANSVLIPVQAHYLSAKGMELLIGTVAKVKRNINPDLDFNGILITMYDGRLRFSKSILSELREACGQHIRIYDTMIPQSVKAVENTAEGKSLFLLTTANAKSPSHTRRLRRRCWRMAKANLKGFDDLFKSSEQRDEKSNGIASLPISKLQPFSKHPFKRHTPEKLRELADSIEENGVIVPILVRPMDNGMYEIVAGHNRVEASSLVGMDVIPCDIREMDDDTATILMVDSNLQRETVLPSEKAWAYRYKLEAIKSQGKRNDLTSAQLVPKLDAREIVAKESGENRMQISRYIRLTHLIPQLLDKVDEKKLAFIPAVELSYLKEHEQKWLYSNLEREE